MGISRTKVTNPYLSKGALANLGLFLIFRNLFTEGEVKLLYILVPGRVYGDSLDKHLVKTTDQLVTN